MTYQNIGYWVGQANDSSTGSHPTGWTTGQRWSETAGEWQTMYNTEYGTARDTSGGGHPTGWVSGQLWSTTASQWNTMYTAEYNNARDTSGGQTNSGLGTHHPTGWVNAQLWRTTAEQWNAMWGNEWRSARDPQGYSFSYPGQAPNAVYWSQSSQYWRGQADYYWGPNRVWNNGSTWEQLYNAYVGYYNDMVSQRDTWASRANSAWGPSRAWNNGESWEAAYNRVLPPYQGQAELHANAPNRDNSGELARVTLNRTGYWAVVFRGSCNQGNGAGSAGISLNSGDSLTWDAGGGETMYSGVGLTNFSVWGAGTVITANYTNNGGGNSVRGDLHAYFVSSQAYPH